MKIKMPDIKQKFRNKKKRQTQEYLYKRKFRDKKSI